MRCDITRTLLKFLERNTVRHLKDITSIIVHGSAARDETSIYMGENENILLGNIGITIISKSNIADRMRYVMLMKHIKSQTMTWRIKTPLILLKPFEITLLQQRDLLQGKAPRDIWVFEMVNSGRVVYGQNLLYLFNPEFELNAGLKMIINRLFGLNLCLPLIAKGDYDSQLKLIAINYECTKGVLAALEGFLVLLKKYKHSYLERAKQIDIVVDAFSDILDSKVATKTFKLASSLKLNPKGLERLSPNEYWFDARTLLRKCLNAYGVSVETKNKRLPHNERIRKFTVNNLHRLFFILSNGSLDPRVLLPIDSRINAIQNMFNCIFSLKPKQIQNRLKELDRLIKSSMHANYVYTGGQWCQITDHISRIQPIN